MPVAQSPVLDVSMGERCEWEGREVPPAVHKALKAPLRGRNFGAKAMRVFYLFEEEVVLKAPEVFTQNLRRCFRQDHHERAAG